MTLDFLAKFVIVKGFLSFIQVHTIPTSYYDILPSHDRDNKQRERSKRDDVFDVEFAKQQDNYKATARL